MWSQPDYRDESLARKPGNGTPLLMVGVAKANADGRYSISATPTAGMLKAAAENDGWINFLMATSTGADFVLEAVSRHWDGTKWTSYGNERPGMSPDDLHKTVFATDLNTGQQKYGSSPRVAARTADLNSITPMAPPNCMEFTEYWSYANTVVMEFHNTADADSKWEYGGTADSDVDYGVTYSGGNWTTSGSTHVGNSAGSAIGANISSHFGQYVATRFRYGNGFLGGPNCAYEGSRFVSANRWEGGNIAYVWDVSQYDCLDAPQSNWKDYYPQGGYWKKYQARAAKIGIAANPGPLNVGATSGYSTRVDMEWTATRNFIYICGSNAYPRYAKIVYTY